MPSRKNRRNRRKPTKNMRRDPQTTALAPRRRAETLVVAWVIASMTAAVLTVVSASMLMFANGSSERTPSPESIHRMTLFGGMVAGAVAIFFITATYRFRILSPPLPITTTALVFSLAPWLVAVGRWIFRTH